MLKAALVLALVALALSVLLLIQGAVYGKTITLHDFVVPLLSAAVLLGLLDAAARGRSIVRSAH
ncbi:MAG: hypothetical protein JNK16_11485 [Phycisphaerales bacterium]|nr:hypothetical protein [Phycisphaerales bacterium]